MVSDVCGAHDEQAKDFLMSDFRDCHKHRRLASWGVSHRPQIGHPLFRESGQQGETATVQPSIFLTSTWRNADRSRS